MSIQVTSTTDTKANVTAAMGAAKPLDKPVEEKSAPGAKAPEQKETTESEPVETEIDEEAADESGEEDSKEESESKDTEKPRKKSGFQRRVDKLTREREFWREQALKGASTARPEPKVEPVEKPKDAGEPQSEDFETAREYYKAIAQWEIKQEKAADEQRSRKAQLETEHQTVLKTHRERVASFKENAQDFDEVLEGVDDIIASPAVKDLIMTSENGPALMYALAKDRAEFERINQLPPIAAARELGRYESKLAASSVDSKKPEAKKTTQAPKPISPVGSKGGTVEKSIYDPNLSQKEYEALRAKERAAAS